MRTIRDLVEQLPARGSAAALTDGVRTFSYAELAQVVNDLGGRLIAAGLTPGDRVLIPAHNELEVAIGALAVMNAGLVQVPLNPKYSGALLDRIVEDADPRAILLRGPCPSGLAEILRQRDPLILGERATLEGLPGTHIDLQALTPEAVPASRGPGDLAAIMFTSGTTGTSKGVELPQRFFVRMAEVTARERRLNAGDRDYTCLPLAHIGGQAFAFLTAISVGATMIIDREFHASSFWRRMAELEVNQFHWLGGMIGILFNQPRSEWERSHSVRVAYGAGIPASQVEEFEERFHLRIWETYGLTETGATCGGWRGERPVGAVGRLVDGIEGRALAPDGNVLPPGEPGELCFRPLEPFIFATGYWRRPLDSLELFRGLWLHTGDLGKVDADGFVYYHGRMKDSIRRRGQNISAFEVEEVFFGRPQIPQSAAVGILSAVGEEEVALVVGTEGQAPIAVDDLVRLADAGLPKFMRPIAYGIVPALPCTETGRVQKKAVLEMIGRGDLPLVLAQPPRHDLGPIRIPGVSWVRQLRLPLAPHAVGKVNAFIVDTAEGPVLVDTGYSTTAQLLSESLAVAGVGRGDLRALLVTHHHADHVGAARWLRDHGWLSAPAPIIASLACAQLGAEMFGSPERQRTDLELHGLTKDELSEWSQGMAVMSELAAWIPPDRTVGDGSELAFGDTRLRFLLTPGHSPDHVAILGERAGGAERVAFLGDLTLGRRLPQAGVRDWIRADPLGDLLEAWDRLAAERIQIGLPGHGQPVTDLLELRSKIVREYGEQLLAFADRFAGRQITAAEAMREAAADGSFGAKQFAFFSALSVLRHLTKLGIVAPPAARPARYDVPFEAVRELRALGVAA